MPDVRRSASPQRSQNVAHPDRAVAELAARQHGVVARRQLAAVGLSTAMINRRVDTGRLLRLHRGVYAVGHRRLRREGFWLAAVLAVGPGAVLSHRDAAALHGLRPSNGASTDVTTARHAMTVPGIRVHTARRLDPADTMVVERIPVTTSARTLVDLATVVPPDHVAKAIVEADRLRILDMRAIEQSARRARGRRGPGHAVLATALAEHRARGTSLTRSALEDAFLGLIRHAGLPEPQTNAWLGEVEADAHWPDQRVAVELDGWRFHRSRKAFQRDRAKATALTVAGYRVLRYTHEDVVRRPRHVADDLRRVLGEKRDQLEADLADRRRLSPAPRAP